LIKQNKYIKIKSFLLLDVIAVECILYFPPRFHVVGEAPLDELPTFIGDAVLWGECHTSGFEYDLLL
jgi:hypothetical protein